MPTRIYRVQCLGCGQRFTLSGHTCLPEHQVVTVDDGTWTCPGSLEDGREFVRMIGYLDAPTDAIRGGAS